MISNENKEKAELADLIKRFVEASKAVTRAPYRPEREIAERLLALEVGLGKLRMFLTNPENWSGDLSTADLGELFDEELSCSCFELEPKFPEGHHPDCDRWDPQDGTSVDEDAEAGLRYVYFQFDGDW